MDEKPESLRISEASRMALGGREGKRGKRERKMREKRSEEDAIGEELCSLQLEKIDPQRERKKMKLRDRNERNLAGNFGLLVVGSIGRLPPN